MPVIRSSREVRARLRVCLVAAGTMLAVACGSAVPSGSVGAEGTAAAPASASSASGPFAGRRGELLNPDASSVVFLYYDLAGISPPLDQWVEDDSRVKYAAPIDKASRRVAVKAELETARAAVRRIGAIRLSTNANLSDYDPTYGEFTVRALAPSSVFSFDALGQKVTLNLGNGRTAQIWRVPAAQAQSVRDTVSLGGGAVNLDVLLRITDVQPGVGGGSITADAVEYEMRESRTGTSIARVQVSR